MFSNLLTPCFHCSSKTGEASSQAMACHSFEVIQAAVQHINPGQAPVSCVDQTLFAQGKQLQWSLDSAHGEDQFVILLGGLHTKMTSYKMLVIS